MQFCENAPRNVLWCYSDIYSPGSIYTHIIATVWFETTCGIVNSWLASNDIFGNVFLIQHQRKNH